MQHRDPEKMEEMIAFIDKYYEDYHRTPSTREIAAGTTLKKSSVHNYLAALRDQGQIDYDGRMIVTEKINDLITGYNRAGIIGKIPCGAMSLEEENIEEYVNLPISIFGGGNLFLLHTYGDSMTGCVSSIGFPQNRKNISLLSDQEFRFFGSGHGKRCVNPPEIFSSCVGTEPLPV